MLFSYQRMCFEVAPGFFCLSLAGSRRYQGHQTQHDKGNGAASSPGTHSEPGSDDAALAGFMQQVTAAGGLQFGVNVFEVGMHRVRADVKLSSNFLVGAAAG